ncbi:pyrroline-5-carboxylate reductase family protein, partial [Streptococcus suis]
LSNHNPAKAKALQTQLGGQLLSNGKIAEQAEVIFLGVKPHLIQKVLSGLQDQIRQNPSAICITIAAGVNLDSLAAFV